MCFKSAANRRENSRMDPREIANWVGKFNYNNGSYNTPIQENHPFGAIDGLKYKGLYQYDKYSETEIPGVSGPNAPVARDVNGNVITDANGEPLAMMYAYNNESKRMKFRGGDAIYEDVNNDGSIDELDIVYLGNSNPKFNGGFGGTLRWKTLSVTAFFNFRYGNKIVNMARMNAENMYTNDNQSKAVNWRWRKDGDITDMPRALYNYGYNWLGSDRYVEDGSFLRFKYLTFNYSVPMKVLKPYKLNKLNFYLTINNLFCWTKYTGVDPEISLDTFGISYDKSKTPRTKDFTFGVSVGF